MGATLLIAVPTIVHRDVSSTEVANAAGVRSSAAACLDPNATLVGTAGPDTLTGTAGNDTIIGLGGDDTINGLGGDDLICGDDGNDTLVGGDGNDSLDGGNGNDHLDGGAGDDVLEGNADDDVVDGGPGNDFLDGGIQGCCTMQPNTGNDTLSGGDGADELWSADFGRVTIHGGPGNDTLHGLVGDDALFGDDGDDIIDGFSGNDLLNGGPGADQLTGSSGDDSLDTRDAVVGNDSADGGDGTDRCDVEPSDKVAACESVVVAQRTLAIVKTGQGVVSTSPAGIDCGATCSASFDFGATVSLTARATAGFAFVGWSGGCTGTAGCSVTMDGDKTITANFTGTTSGRRLLVVKSGSGSGRVLSDPPGIECGQACTASYPDGTKVVLTASPTPGSTFAGWSGACSGIGSCAITLQGDDATATAKFDAATPGAPPPPPPSPSPAKSDVAIEPGEAKQEPPAAIVQPGPDPAKPAIVVQSVLGAGDVIVTGGGRSLEGRRSGAARATALCGLNGFRCYAEFASQTRVELVARPAPGFAFNGWQGSCSGHRPKCSVLLTSRRSVSATFVPRKGQEFVRVEIERPRFQIRWDRSVGSGKLVVRGRLSRPTVVQLELRRPHGGPLVSERVPLLGGPFTLEPRLARGLLPPGAIFLPGGFSVLIGGRSGHVPVLLQLRSLVLPAPAEGVVVRAYSSRAEGGGAVRSLPSGAKEAYANFVFAAQPHVPLKLSASWYRPGGRLLGTVAKSNRPVISTFVRASTPLPPGSWRVVLRAGNRIVKQLTVNVARSK